MASGTIKSKQSLNGSISATDQKTATATSGSGVTDHNRLFNRDAANQHPISAITGLEDALAEKVNLTDISNIIAQANDKKVKGLFFDTNKQFAKKAYWYLTSEIDPVTGQGDPGAMGQYIVSGPYNIGAGGGGGGDSGSGGVTTVTLVNKDPVTKEPYWPTSVAVGATVILKVNWSSKRDGDPTGNGTMYVYVNDTLVVKKSVPQGDYECDISAYLKSGSNKVEFKVQDAYSTVKNLIGNINAVSLKLTSAFEDDVSYTGSITYTYVPIGDITKTVHFIIDGRDYAQDIVKTTGEQCTKVLPIMSHGAHTLQVYFTAVLGDDLVTSNTLKYDLITYVAGNNTPIIASTFASQSEQEQYVAFNIRYRVYTPGKNTSSVELFIDGQSIGDPLSVDMGWQNWEIRPVDTGNHVYVVKTGDVSRTFNVHVYESTIQVDPVTDNQVLCLTTFGRSNAETPEVRKKWDDTDHDIHCTLTGFNWSSNGWVQDEDGATVLRLSGDARVEIPYQPFYKDLQQTGKTIEIEFATTDVKKYESRILECLTGGDALNYSYTLAGEDDRAKYFTVTEVDNNKFVEAVRGDHRTYLFLFDGTNWILDGEAVDLGEDNIYGITIRKEDRDGTPSDYFIEGDRITVAYEVVGRGLYITPQLAKFQSQLSSLSTQYKENEHVRIAFVIEKRTENRLIYMYINGIISGVARYPLGDTFEQAPAANIILGSNDATLDVYTIRIYDNSLTRKQVVNNWIADMRDPVVKAVYFQDNDNFDETGKVIIEKIPSRTPYMVLTGEALPGYKKDKKNVDVEFIYPGSDERYFTAKNAQIDVQGTSSQYYYRKNFKINFKDGFDDIDGNHSNKYKFIPPLSKKEKKFTFKADVASSEGANNVELVRYFELTKNFYMPAELDQDADDTADGYNTKDRVRTGIDGFPIIMFHDNTVETYFYGKMNFNNDKDNKDTFGFSDGDECWEFINNTTPLALFQSDDLSTWTASFESRYPEEYGDDEHIYGTQPGELDKLQAVMTWVASTRRLDTDSEEVKAQKLAKFRNEFTRHFDLQSSLFYYLYTELFLMVDSRAKNAMLAYLRSHKPGDGGNKWYWLPYDMDTAIGTNNEGLLVFNYDAEDTDQVNGANVYNGQKSTFWCNLRDAFGPELKQLYADLRSGNAGGDMAWSYDIIEKLFEDHQAYWSASIFNEDSYTKYLEPLIKNNDATYLGMAQGSKEEQRKWWLWNRFRYLDSKYRTGDAKGENIMLRAYQRDDITITPYINCYVTAVFDQAVDDLMVTVDAQKDTAYTITPPSVWQPGNSDAVLIIYSADLLRDIGDISGLKPGYADFSAATKLQRLQIGSTAPGYSNNKLEVLNVGNNHLLTYIDARNCSGLGTGDTKVIDLSNCTSIEECYFDNTNIQGINFPVGGNLKKVHLPASITDLTIRNHPNLDELVLAGTNKLTSVWLEDIPSTVMDTFGIISNMADGSNVRLININETVDTIDDIRALYLKLNNMKGKDSKGDTTDKAQITGVIHIPGSQTNPVSYAEWKELLDMYPEVEIDAKVLCTVTFWNDDTEHDVQFIERGTYAQTPAIPLRAPTAQYYYTFNSWDAPYLNVLTDLDIHAIYDDHIQTYHVIYDTRSSVIEVNPEYDDLLYGSLIPEPTIDESTIPSGVRFLGWYTANNDIIDFETKTVSGDILNFPDSMNITLAARWQDENVPVVTLTRVAYNKFAYKATDNMGVTGWIVNGSAEVSLEDPGWTEITPTTLFEGEYTIEAAGDYYFHVKDDQGNISWAKLHADTITLNPNINNERDTFTGQIILQLSENDVPMTNFALLGTSVAVRAINDDHYENLTLYYNGIQLSQGDEIIIDGPTIIDGSVTPKVYRVVFNMMQEGDPVSDQYIKYRHLIEEPDPQLYYGDALTAWIAEDLHTWQFMVDEVVGNMELKAQWDAVQAPTYISLYLPTGVFDITLNFNQSNANGLEIDWGDHTDAQRINTVGQVSITHTYAQDDHGYTLTLARKSGTYLLGQDASTPAIVPISTVWDLNFSYDVPSTRPGAFRGAINLEAIHLTKFMTSIAASAFRDCSRAATFKVSGRAHGEDTTILTNELPSSIKDIGENAFDGCIALTAVSFPAKVSSIRRYAFRGCTSLETVTFNPQCAVSVISAYAFEGCTALSSISLSNNITTIDNYAFYSCSALTSISLPASVTVLNNNVFRNCASLESVIFAAPSMTFGANCLQGCPHLTSAGPIGGNYAIQFAWTEKIPDNAFSADDYGRLALTSVILPDTIKEVGDHSFAFCDSLISIQLPNGLEIIGNLAFQKCVSLSTITVPNSVISIGDNAFESCTGLRRANLYLTSSDHKITIPINGWFSFCGRNAELHIPSEITLEIATSAYGPYWHYRTASELFTVINDL